MPSNWLYVDTNFPTFTGHETVNEKIDTIQSYLYVLLEQLRYCLHNLDMSNMNEVELNAFVSSVTEPVYKRLEDAEGNITSLQLTAQGLALRIANAEGDITNLQVTAQGLALRISNAEGDITSLQVTAQGLASRVTNAEGSISSLEQTVNGFQFTVADRNGTTFLELTSGSATLASLNISLLGTVTIPDLSQSGSTVINGDNITTGTVLSRYIKLMGMLTVYDDAGTPWGVLGHMRGLAQPVPGGAVFSTDGIGFASTAPDLSQVYGMCIATNAGARITFGNAEMVALSGACEVKAGATTLRVWDNGQVTVNGSALPAASAVSAAYLGSASAPWAGTYEAAGTIVTSDRNRKHDIQPLPGKYLDMLERVRPRRFRLNDGSSGRFHVGFIAQEVERAMAEAGVSSGEFAGWVRDRGADGEDVFMLRYDEFIGLLWGEILRLEGRITTLEGLL